MQGKIVNSFAVDVTPNRAPSE